MAIDLILTPADLRGGQIPPAACLGMGNAEDAILGLDDSRWDVVFFCAEEIPPPEQAFRDRSRKVKAYHVQLDDAELSKNEAFLAAQAANVAARYFLKGARVLVTCAMGKNRSGLVTALAIDALTGEGGRTAAGLVKMKRHSLGIHGPALTNASFLHFLSQVEPRNVVAKQSRSSLIV